MQPEPSEDDRGGQSPDAPDVSDSVRIAELTAVLADADETPRRRGAAVDSLADLAARVASSRDVCISALTGQLQSCELNDVELNTHLVRALLGLRAGSSAVAIGRAYHARRVDEIACGTWDQARRKLGIAPQFESSRPREGKSRGSSISPGGSGGRIAATGAQTGGRSGGISKSTRAANKNKRKKANISRKRNRKRKKGG